MYWYELLTVINQLFNSIIKAIENFYSQFYVDFHAIYRDLEETIQQSIFASVVMSIKSKKKIPNPKMVEDCVNSVHVSSVRKAVKQQFHSYTARLSL